MSTLALGSVRVVAAMLLAMSCSGCVTLAVTTAYMSVTDERSVREQASDMTIAGDIRNRILDVDAKGLLTLDVFCHRGFVVIAGVLPAAAPLRSQAVKIALAVDGVRRVETYYLDSPPTKLQDLGIASKIQLKLVSDDTLFANQVDFSVLGSHVVLVGVVDRQDKVDRIVAHARSVDGVKVIRSFIQIKPPKPNGNGPTTARSSH